MMVRLEQVYRVGHRPSLAISPRVGFRSAKTRLLATFPSCARLRRLPQRRTITDAAGLGVRHAGHTISHGPPPMKIIPLNDQVVIRPLDAEAKTAGGIVLPDAAREKPQQGRVLAV